MPFNQILIDAGVTVAPGLLVLIATTGCASGPHSVFPANPAEERAAIAHAEQFVRANGYVRESDADPASASYESLELDLPLAELVARLAGQLIFSACAVEYSYKTWTVAFCYDPRRLQPNPRLGQFVHRVGRAVLIFDDEQPPRIAHQDILLTASTTKPLSGMKELEAALRQPR